VLPVVVLLPSLSVETIGLVVMAVSPECPAAPAAKMVVVLTVDVMVLLSEVMVVSMTEVVMADVEAAAAAEAEAVKGVSLVWGRTWNWGV
jgi:hypothetical protein